MATTAEERKAARAAKTVKRKEVRAKRKKSRVAGRAAIKKIRQNKDISGYERRMRIGGARAYHKTDSEGTAGGMKAMFAHSQKVGPAMTKRADRIKAREARSTERAAAKAKSAELKTSMKTKQSQSSYLKQDTDFFKRNAKQRGMKLADYYAKYVK